MPTYHDETLQQRYAREHQQYLALCGSMTAEQVADLQLQLNNALAHEAALHLRLNAADQRNDELLGLLRECAPLVKTKERWIGVKPLEQRVDEAINPATEGARYDPLHSQA
jgi:hypothetical protein